MTEQTNTPIEDILHEIKTKSFKSGLEKVSTLEQLEIVRTHINGELEALKKSFNT